MKISNVLHKWFQIGMKKYSNSALSNPQSYIVTGSGILFRDYFIGFLSGLDGENRSRSYTITVTMAAHIIDGLGNYKMSELNKDVLRKFINGFAKQKYLKNARTNEYAYYSQSTINKVYNLLHMAIKEAASEDGEKLLRIDYMENIKKPRTRQAQKPPLKAFSHNELQQLLKAIRESRVITTWICIMLYTGIRPSEALALMWKDINYQEGTIEISKALSQEDYFDISSHHKIKPSVPVITDLKNERDSNKSNWQRRTLRVGKGLLNILSEWEQFVKGDAALMKKKRECGTEEYLFCGSKGQLWLYEYYSEIYKRLLEKHGLKYSDYNPYRFRHNYCTCLFRANVNIKAAQLIMGDNTPTMVMKVYANLDKSDVLKGSGDLSESIDEAFFSNKHIDSPYSDILSE